jgi:hypothetical protein
MSDAMPMDPRENVSMFEWRLLTLERSSEVVQERIRLCEAKADVLEERMVGMQDKVDRIDKNVDTLTSDRYKNLWGFGVTIAAVFATFLLQHFIAAAR